MIKSTSKILLICLFLTNFFIHSPVFADNENTIKLPKNTRLVTEFEKIPTGVTIGGDFFYGILISESDFDIFVEDKIKLNNLEEQLEIYKQFDVSINFLFDKYNETTMKHIDEIKQILNKPEQISFWDENKAWIMLAVGVVIGVISYKVITL
jgi:hypothetical protein